MTSQDPSPESIDVSATEQLASEIERVRTNEQFTAKAKGLLDRDQVLIDRLRDQ